MALVEPLDWWHGQFSRLPFVPLLGRVQGQARLLREEGQVVWAYHWALVIFATHMYIINFFYMGPLYKP